jgi:hypothetical protein
MAALRCAINYVVTPRRLAKQATKRQKIDRLDARSLLENLDSCLRGDRDAMSIVTVPCSQPFIILDVRF